MAATYLDSSAIVKLAIAEPESSALRRFLRGRTPLVSSALSRAEVQRALLFEGEPGTARGKAVLSRIDTVRVSDRVLNAAGTLQPASLRSLDAIHLATALLLGGDLGLVVTYDERMFEAACELGLKAQRPGQ
jgi:predicted nucleic acid-binding protein